MENQNAQDFVESLSVVINDIQAKVKGLSDITITLGEQLEKQGKTIEENSVLSNEVFSTVNQFIESVAKKGEEIKAVFLNLYDTQKGNEQAVDLLITMNKDTIEKVSHEVTTIDTSFSNLLTDLIHQSHEYKEQTDVNLKRWQQQSDDLISDLSYKITEIDDLIRIELEQASESMSKTLSTTLRNLIDALTVTNCQIGKSRKMMLIMALITSVSIIVSITITFVR